MLARLFTVFRLPPFGAPRIRAVKKEQKLRAPILLVECKIGARSVDPSLEYLEARFPKAEAWQLSLDETRDYVTPEGIRVAPALGFLRELV